MCRLEIEEYVSGGVGRLSGNSIGILVELSIEMRLSWDCSDVGIQLTIDALTKLKSVYSFFYTLGVY